VHVGVCRIEFQIPGGDSLKAKRRVVSSIKDRVAQRFRVAIAEVGRLDSSRFGELGIACVSNDARHATSILTNVANFIESSYPIIVVDVDTELW
jgi:hypothetical protein